MLRGVSLGHDKSADTARCGAQAARALRRAEIALRDQVERVATLRRQLPLETVLPDYGFREGPSELGAGDAPIRERRLSQLFDRPDQTLVLMHFMFGGSQLQACPMCTMWADG